MDEREAFANMLVDQNDANVLTLRREVLKGGLDRSVVRLVVYHKEVLP